LLSKFGECLPRFLFERAKCFFSAHCGAPPALFGPQIHPHIERA
jgi:hypothetical protein